MITVINTLSLSELSQAAKLSPRLRKNLNFHASNEAHCHRLLNALEPGTYIQPHRHLDPEKEESMILIRGRFGILIFDTDGAIVQQLVMAADSGNLGITIPAGVFHSMLALESGSVFFESKAGPYAALSEAEKASWAPVEGESGWQQYLETMRAHFGV